MSDNVNKPLPADQSGPTTGNRRGAPRTTGVPRAVIALGICAAAIAGCASSERTEPATSSAVPNRQVATTAPPAALSSSAYQDRLRSASSAVGPAFDRLAAAGSLEDARTELEQASTAASEAARLLDVDPPLEVLAVHRDLLAGLRQLATDMSQLSDQVASMELCAAPAILAAVSNTSGVNSLRTVSEALGSGRSGVSYQWGEFLPDPVSLSERRLSNGQLIDNQRRNGSGQLEVDNGTEQDAVVKLVQGGKPIVSVYVRGGSETTVENINDGSYEMFYTSGVDWDDELKAFTRSCQFERFEAPVEFTTVSVEGGINYTVQSVGLQPRIGGNARTTEVPAESFPK